MTCQHLSGLKILSGKKIFTQSQCGWLGIQSYDSNCAASNLEIHVWNKNFGEFL